MAEPDAGAFTVEPAALRELAQTLLRLYADFGAARVETSALDASGFGDQRLCDAVHHFVEHWKWGHEHMASALQDTAEHLMQAARQYEKVEEAQRAAQGSPQALS